MNETAMAAFFDELEKIANARERDVSKPMATGAVVGSGLAALSGEGLTTAAKKLLGYGLDRAEKVPVGRVKRFFRDKGINVVRDSVRQIRTPYGKLVPAGAILGALMGLRKGLTSKKGERQVSPVDLLT